MTYLELFEAELDRYGIDWCRGGCGKRSSHSRGFATVIQGTDSGMVHFDSKIARRTSLLGGLHEIGHVVLDHGKSSRLRRFEQVAAATDWAVGRMRELGVPVPRAEIEDYRPLRETDEAVGRQRRSREGKVTPLTAN